MPSNIVDLGGQNLGLGITENIAPSYPYAGFLFQGFSVITASTTHTQAGATPITSTLVQVTNGNASDAVLLPPATPGLEITIKNNSANSLQVYASGSDTIQLLNAGAVAGSTGVAHALGAAISYFCFVTGQWQKQT